ncbi:arylsulfatase [uncultured Cyclobacterium sp.]|uniref:arylsulfatase n=1 Tax=uncultured Cyclobacterium sp. TaxID=453820 RepID=UPI0030EE03DC|tara:strand:- start:8052 stop:9584 length:1533 start_codon:yes stop_codon:yes gene_type:complete
MTQKSLIYLLFALVLYSCAEKKAPLPNIILIMGDDIGYSDIGAYGGEIETPNINRLADGGLKFRTFYNMAKCNPTRSTMLTGLYDGGAGAVHIANLTKQAGYNNIMSGKEHFDPWVPEYCKAENVFDHSFYFWATTEYFLPPSGAFERPFYLEGKELRADEIEHEKSPMYKTDFITDYALKWLDETFEKEEPFFLYLPYHAAHYPLQARPEDIEKYRGKYLKGWDVLRQERFDRMEEMGVLPQGAKLSPPENNLNKSRGPLLEDYTDYYAWDSLSSAKKDSLDLEMAVFAAIVDRMDQNIGRVLKKLEENGKLENTIIMYLNDNGSCPFYTNKIPDKQPGPADSYWSLRTNWAMLGNTPFRQHKQSGLEGGSHTPFIAYWPGKIAPNTITDQVGHVVDIAPTFLDLLNIQYPDSIHGHATLPLHGSSLLPVFMGELRPEPAYFISGMDKFRMFRSGDYKIVRMNGGEWELYHIKNDPSELVNLADTMPGKVKELAMNYEATPAGSAKNHP